SSGRDPGCPHPGGGRLLRRQQPVRGGDADGLGDAHPTLVDGRPLRPTGTCRDRVPRDLPVASHVQAGAAIARGVSGTDQRVALVASCDHGHGHLADGPYGFRPESATFDELVCSIVRDDRLADVADIDPDLVRAAAADSWWQMLMLAGALDGGWTGQFLAYERPTHVGLMCAAYAPPAASAV